MGIGTLDKARGRRDFLEWRHSPRHFPGRDSFPAFDGVGNDSHDDFWDLNEIMFQMNTHPVLHTEVRFPLKPRPCLS